MLLSDERPRRDRTLYLLGGARLVRDVPAGHLLTFDDLTGVDATGQRLFERRDRHGERGSDRTPSHTNPQLNDVTPATDGGHAEDTHDRPDPPRA